MHYVKVIHQLVYQGLRFRCDMIENRLQRRQIMKFDVIIGSGLAGLTAGIRLAEAS